MGREEQWATNLERKKIEGNIKEKGGETTNTKKCLEKQ